MVPKDRSNSGFRYNHALTKVIFCQEKYPHLLLSSREHRFQLRQCVKYSRILWEGVKLEEIKIDTPYAKQNLREDGQTQNFIQYIHSKSSSLKILNEQSFRLSVVGSCPVPCLFLLWAECRES